MSVGAQPSTLLRNGQLRPGRPAIVCAEFPPFSFRELDRRSGRLAKFCPPPVSERPHVSELCCHMGPRRSSLPSRFPPMPSDFHSIQRSVRAEFEFEVARAGLDAIVLPDWVNLPSTGTVRTQSVGTFFASRANKFAGRDRSKARSSNFRPRAGRWGAPSLHSVVCYSNVFGIDRYAKAYFGYARQPVRYRG